MSLLHFLGVVAVQVLAIVCAGLWGRAKADREYGVAEVALILAVLFSILSICSAAAS